MHKTSRTRRRRWRAVELFLGPIGFMVMVYIYLHESHKNQPNVGKHIIYGILWVMLPYWERSHIPYRFRHFWVDECSFPVRWEFCDRFVEGILMISVAFLLNFWKHKRMLFRGKYGDCTFKDFPPKKDQHDFHVFGFSWPQTESSLIQQNMLPNGGAWACVEVQNIIVQTVDNAWALSHVHPVPPKTMVVKKPSIKGYLLIFIVFYCNYSPEHVTFHPSEKAQKCWLKRHISLKCLSIQNSFGTVGHYFLTCRRSMQQDSVIK